ncbi:MAG: thioredoxin [Bacteroidetes bacterium]|jgi:thioredoxin-like negative regulator of GroEL|nr:thioredoxin [bacterium]NBP66581.1 thioredoxin [Bacteroidota bacterium]
MIPLENQQQFEALLNPANKNPPLVVVYFTATWCGPCSRLDKDRIQTEVEGATWYKCDIDQNKYTLGYCGLKSVPSFCVIKNSKFLGKFSSSDTDAVIEMINSTTK